jgi:hypothetical protein
MTQRPYEREFLQGVLDEFTRCGGNKAELARRLGKSRSTVQHQIEAALTAGLTPLKFSPTAANENLLAIIEGLRSELTTARESLAKATRPRFTVRADTSPQSEKLRLICIGDAHDTPAIPDKSRFELIGQYVRSIKPDVVVQIGDFADLDSLNSHVPNQTLDGKLKPSFESDMGSFNLALQAMSLDGIEKHCTLGNHERRLWLYEQNNPEMAGKLSATIDSIFHNNGWTYSPYGQITYYGGVGFVHAALNRLGKTYGGKNAEQTIANDSIHDLVIGHSHTDRKHRAPKIGGNHEVQIINVGCALPQGYMFPYANHATTGWSYGIADMTIQHGHVQSYHFITMDELGERYGLAA